MTTPTPFTTPIYVLRFMAYDDDDYNDNDNNIINN